MAKSMTGTTVDEILYHAEGLLRTVIKIIPRLIAGVEAVDRVAVKIESSLPASGSPTPPSPSSSTTDEQVQEALGHLANAASSSQKASDAAQASQQASESAQAAATAAHAVSQQTQASVASLEKQLKAYQNALAPVLEKIKNQDKPLEHNLENFPGDATPGGQGHISDNPEADAQATLKSDTAQASKLQSEIAADQAKIAAEGGAGGQ